MDVLPDQAALIDALLPQIPSDGWTMKALRQALASLGRDPEDAPLAFPNGPGEMIEAFSTLADARMAAAAAGALGTYGMTKRVREIIAIRLEQNRDNREAIRRALAWLALPMHAPLAARITANTVDAIWHAAGDTAADMSWYTKRGLLAGVYSTTVLYWLRDLSAHDEDSLAFLDRRLKGIGKIGGARKKLEARLASARQKLSGFSFRRA